MPWDGNDLPPFEAVFVGATQIVADEDRSSSCSSTVNGIADHQTRSPYPSRFITAAVSRIQSRGFE